MTYSSFQIRLQGLDAEIDVHVVISLALEIVAEISLAFHQQIVVYSALLKNRNVAFENPLGNLGLNGFHLDLRAGHDIERRANAAMRMVVI